jgi:hypothetical protein
MVSCENKAEALFREDYPRIRIHQSFPEFCQWPNVNRHIPIVTSVAQVCSFFFDVLALAKSTIEISRNSVEEILE